MSRVSVGVFRKASKNCFYFIWTDPVSRKRKTKSSGLKKKRDAERAAARFEEKLNRLADPEAIKWSDFVSLHERHSLRHLSDSTAYSVGAAFSWFETATGVRYLHEVPNLVSRFKLALLDSNLATATQVGYLKHFRSAVNWAHEHGYLADRISLKLPAGPETEMKGRPLTKSEYESMLETAEEQVHADSIVHAIKGLWLSGLRRGELMRLSWDRDAPFAVDLSGEYPRFRIRNRAQKSKRAQLAPITPDFSEFLLKEKEQTGFVFNPLGHNGCRVSADCLGRIVSSIGDKAGIITDTETGRHATCHDFRRSFGDRWARKVMPPDLKELMRHRSIETTMKYYVGRDVDSISARLRGLEDGSK